jgi:sugar transferase (PEP-CTERM/EpsH1 system associated)
MKPSLLFISQQLPYPLTDGGNVRTFKILEALAARYAVTLVASLREGTDREKALDAVIPLCKEVVCVADVKSRRPFFLARAAVRALRRGLPLSIAYNYNPALLRASREALLTGRFQVVHFNHLDAVQHAPGDEHRVRRVLDTHNLLFELYQKSARFESSRGRRVLQRLEARRLLAYERRTFLQMDRVLVCSRREADAIEAWGLADRTQVVPNGVDCEYFAPPLREYADNPPVLVFTGAMSYGPNADAAIHFIGHTLPLLRTRVPGVRFVVVGKNPTEELLEAGRRHPDVTVTGTVADVREYVHAARIFVVPLRMGAGTRLKVLEAFALGIPAVSTSVGAEGIDYEEERHLLIAETPAAMANAVCRLLEDAELARRMSLESRELALSLYDWNAVGQRLLAEYSFVPVSVGTEDVAVDTKR